MGGKQKQAQRTKGNVKPSSSSRAAELLASSGASSSGFIGFGALSGDLGYVPVTGGNEEIDASIDADFRMVLRRMSKRDATTRLKALQEMTSLCQEKDVEAVQTILAFWPRIYSKVAIDCDRRVREAAQQALEQVATRVRRSLAPHLRSLMGTWLVAQCDPYAPVASAAKSAFQAAFPPAKQADAILHCKNEIMTYINDNLLTQTAATLSDPKSTDTEDMESKYLRVLAGSLLAWRHLIVTLPAPQDQVLQEAYVAILKEGKFWKLAKHSSNSIRAAFYWLLASLCRTNPEVAARFADKICPQVLHNLDESDPLICPALWEAALSIVTTIPDCWDKINARKGMLPRLWTLLKKGGNGSAALVFSNLLPLLSKLPADVIGEEIGFYQEFFNNIKTGLSEEKVSASPSETGAIVQAMMECLRYTLMSHFTDSPEHLAIQDLLLQDQLMPLLEASFVEKTSALPSSPLYRRTVDLLVYIYKLSSSSDDAKQAQAVSIQKAIWDSLLGLFVPHLEEGGQDFTLERISHFLVLFRNPVAAVKKKTKVMFAEESVAKKKSSKVPLVDSESASPLVTDNESPLREVVSTTCKTAQEHNADLSVPHLDYMGALFRAYVSATLLERLTNNCCDTDEEKPNNLPLEYFQTILLPWLLKCPSDVTVASSLVDILYAVFSIAHQEPKLSILRLFYKSVTNAILVEKFSHTLFEHREPVVTQWFRGEEFGAMIVGVTRQLCENCLHGPPEAAESPDAKAQWALLKVALRTDEHLEPVISEHHMDTVFLTIAEALPTAQQQGSLSADDASRSVAFVCDVAHMLYVKVQGCMALKSAENLLLSLFQLTCQTRSPLTGSVQVKVEKTWQLGLKALLKWKGGLVHEDGFLHQAAAQLKARVLSDANSMDSLEMLNGVGTKLLQLYHCHTGDGKASQLEFASHLCIPLIHTSTTRWWIGPLVSGQLSFDELPLDGTTNPSGCFPKGIAPLAFTSCILTAVAKGNVDAISKENQDQETSDEDCSLGNQESIDGENMLNIAHGMAYCQAAMGHRKEALHTSEMGRMCSLLEGNLQVMYKSLSSEMAGQLLENAKTKSYSEGGLWALALEVLKKLQKEQKVGYCEEMASVLDRLNVLTPAVVQSTQVLASYLPSQELSAFMDVLSAQLLSLGSDIPVTQSHGARGFLSILSQVLRLQSMTLGSEVSAGSSAVSVANEVQLWRETQDGLFILDSDITKCSWPVVALNIEVMRFLSELVAKMPSELPGTLWDFIMCSTVGWIQSIHESQSSLLVDPVIETFAVAAGSLLYEIAVCLRVRQPAQSERFPADLMTEWMEFFSQAAYSTLLPVFIHCTSHIDLAQPSAAEDLLLSSLGAAVSECPAEHLKNHQLPARLIADQETNLSDDLQTILNHVCPLLLAPHRATQLAAYKMLLSVMPILSSFDEGKETDEDLKKEEITRAPPVALITVLETSGASVASHLEGLRVGEHTSLEPYTVEYTAATAYLLSWKLLLAFFKAAASELKAEYVVYLRDNQLIAQLLVQLFRLLPESPVMQLKDALTSAPPASKLSTSKTMFSEHPQLLISGHSSCKELQHLACSAYYGVLKELPAAIRDWWNAQDKRTAAIIDKFTSKYVSPILCAEELGTLQSCDVDSENMAVRVRMTSREVVATYTVGEYSMELVVTLPVNHPLGPIGVESSNHMGVTATQWRNWLLQMTTFLTHQNGSLHAGLMLWKRNVDKRFEGVEECMVCFSVIHSSNYQLPKLTCRVCKKKFHSACLYKWFNTSNNSSCPMCRSLF